MMQPKFKQATPGSVFLSDPPHLWLSGLSAAFDLHCFSKESKNNGGVLSAWDLCRPRDVKVMQISVYTNSFFLITDSAAFSGSTSIFSGDVMGDFTNSDISTMFPFDPWPSHVLQFCLF